MKKWKHRTFWDKARHFPPVLVRLLARRLNGRPLTVAEIAGRSGLSPWQIESLSRQTSWSQVDLPTMQAYITGCGVDFEDCWQMHRVSEYLRERTMRDGRVKRPNFKYLRITPEWESVYSPLMALYLKHAATNNN